MLSASKSPKAVTTQAVPVPGLGRDGNGTADGDPSIICDLAFRFGPRAFLFANENRIIGFAATAPEAERFVTECSRKYRKQTPAIPSGGEFHLIQHEGDNIRTKRVPLSADTILERGTLDLHYGDGAGEWHEGFVREFGGRPNGLTIFEGNPGTGKTFYLRHLMGVPKGTHRFHFIPTSSMEILSKPQFDSRRLGSAPAA